MTTNCRLFMLSDIKAGNHQRRHTDIPLLHPERQVNPKGLIRRKQKRGRPTFPSDPRFDPWVDPPQFRHPIRRRKQPSLIAQMLAGDAEAVWWEDCLCIDRDGRASEQWVGRDGGGGAMSSLPLGRGSLDFSCSIGFRENLAF